MRRAWISSLFAGRQAGGRRTGGRPAEGEDPSLQLAGFRNGYWSPEEERSVVAQVKASNPDVLFVAMSSPKKELFLRKWKNELRVPFVMGVGRTFDRGGGSGQAGALSGCNVAGWSGSTG